MKDTVKRTLLVFCAASVMMISTSVFASSGTTTKSAKTVSASSVTTSASSTTASSSDDDTSESTSSDTTASSSDDDTSEGTSTTTTAAGGVVQDRTKPVPTAISTGQNQTGVVQTTEAQRVAEKKYASKGSIAFWFIFSILINVVISFLIANRFYKLARKDNHVSSELRALRRDLEEKFVSNVGGFSEMETDVANTNDNYSMNGSIKMPERKSTDFAAESEDVFKKWESQMSQRRAARRPIVEEPETEDNYEDEEIEETRPRRKFQPNRKPVEPAEGEYDDEEYEEEPGDSTIQIVKNKAKNLLGDIFPFKED